MKYLFVCTLVLTSTLSSAALCAPQACGLRPVMLERFAEDSIASNHVGPARWTAHTPWNGDFGDARFADPGPGSPFSVRDGVLTITASKEPNGRWKSGLIAAADASGAGTGARYGYFEARMQMPPGPGTWPAFWLAALKPASQKDGNVEIDIVEYYGQFTAAYRNTVHVWRNGKDTLGEGHEVKVSDGALVDDWHNYGVDISPKKIVFFFDGKEVWQTPTPPELDSPMYPIVNLALGSGWPIDKTRNPSMLHVAHVYVYARDGEPPDGCQPGPPTR